MGLFHILWNQLCCTASAVVGPPAVLCHLLEKVFLNLAARKANAACRELVAAAWEVKKVEERKAGRLARRMVLIVGDIFEYQKKEERILSVRRNGRL
jgi:hypothetical protein